MPTAREKLEEILRALRRRQEQQAEAESLWKRALPRCQQIALSLIQPLSQQGIRLDVTKENGELRLQFPNRDAAAGKGAQAVFLFNRQAKSMEGWRLPFRSQDTAAKPEHFFSLTVKVPQQSAHVNEIGPSPIAAAITVDTQDAFERAIVQWIDWAMVGDGCGGESVRLP